MTKIEYTYKIQVLFMTEIVNSLHMIRNMFAVINFQSDQTHQQSSLSFVQFSAPTPLFRSIQSCLSVRYT